MTGIDGYLAIAKETTPGTYLAPGRPLEFISEDLKLTIDPIKSKGIRGGRRTQHTWRQGARRVEGGIEMELGPQGIGLLLELMLGGTPATTAPVGEDYTHQHVFTPGSLADKSASIQVGRPGVDGTIYPFSYIGSTFTDWELSISAQELLMLKASVYAQDELTSEAAVSVTYNDYTPWAFLDGSLSFTPEGGSAVNVCVTDWTLTTANNTKTERFFICAGENGRSRRAIENGERELTGSFTGEFEDLTHYNWFVSGVEGKLVLTFVAPTGEELDVALNVRFDGETPNVTGMEILEETMSYEVTSGTSDADAITVTLRNNDSSV